MLAVRDVERTVAQPVIGAFEGDDAVPAGRERRRLQRRFHSLEAGVAEDGFAGETVSFCLLPFAFCLLHAPPLERQPRQLPRQFRLQWMRMHIAHRVQQRRHLSLAGTDHSRVRMPRRRHAERSGEVEILAAFRVPDVHAARTCPDDGPGAVRLHEGHVARLMGAEQGERFLGVQSVFHPWLKLSSDPALVRCPDKLVHLQLEAHRQRVGDDALDQVQPRDGRLACGHGFQYLVLLVRLQRRDP